MRVLFLIILSLMFNSSSWAYLTAGKVAVTATSSSSGVPSTSQDSDITDTKGSSVSVGVPVDVTGNVNITGNYQVNGTPISATSNWNQNGSTINYTAGNVGIGSVNPGSTLDVVGTVRATNLVGNGSGITGIGSLLGSWTSPTCTSGGTAHQAATDGEFTGVVSADNIWCYTDSANPPTTIRNQTPGVSGKPSGCSAMVKKNDYYMIVTGSVGCTGYFISLGS